MYVILVIRPINMFNFATTSVCKISFILYFFSPVYWQNIIELPNEKDDKVNLIKESDTGGIRISWFKAAINYEIKS